MTSGESQCARCNFDLTESNEHDQELADASFENQTKNAKNEPNTFDFTE